MKIFLLSVLLIFCTNGQLISQTNNPIYSDDINELERFGVEVRLSGVWMAISETLDDSNEDGTLHDGSVHMYKRDGSGLDPWVFKYKITNHNLRDGPALFASKGGLDISGETVVISDIYYDMVGETVDAGRVYVFKRVTDTNWQLEATIIAPNNGVHSGTFGAMVRLDGDHLMIGDGGDDPNDNLNAGSVYYYNRVGTTWTLQQTLLLDGVVSDADDYWGAAIEFNGDNEVVISAGSYDGITYSNEGLVTIWTRSGLVWTQQYTIPPPTHTSQPNNFFFGRSAVCFNDNLLCVAAGAYNMYCYARPDSSSAFVLKSSIDYATPSIYTTKTSYSCAITSSDYLLIGNRPGVASGGQPYSGQVVIYTKNGDDTWTFDSTIAEHPTLAQASYGFSLAVDSFYLVVGAYGYGDGTNANSGVVHTYYMITPSPTASPTTSPTASCSSSTQCTTNTYCGVNNWCIQTACASHGDCVGTFLPGRLPFCGTGGYCKDTYAGTCNNANHCMTEVKKAIIASKGLMTAKRTVSASTGALRKNVTQEMISRVKTTFTLSSATLITLDGTETGTFSDAAITEVGEAAFLAGVKTEMCGDYSGSCTVSIDNSRRMLESGSVTVIIVYNIDDDAYDAIGGPSFENDGFEASLAALLGIGAGNVTVSGVSGQILISITIVEETADGEPLGEAIINEITNINDQLTQITSDLVASTPGLDSGDIETLPLSLCNDRDCHSRGTCDATTGVCACDSNDWWGINCETACNCLNDGVCVNGLCACEYPNYGQRCGSTKDCDC